jgi:outer membrane protein OmpA-like peptidoglycan-associated protein
VEIFAVEGWFTHGKEAPLRFQFLKSAAAGSLLLSCLSLSTTALAREFVDPAFWICPGGGVAWPPAEFGYGQGDVDEIEEHFGGIIGVKLARPLGLEARGNVLSKTADLNDLDIKHGEGNLTWFLTPGKMFVPYLTGGAGVVMVKNEPPTGEAVDDDAFAWNVGAGALIRFTDQIALRLDGRRLAYEVASGDEEKFRPHPEAFAGLNIGFGGKPSDTDKDGVADRDDSCPDTPVGARVDASGCPVDGDADGIADGIDLCDNTPVGAKVDASGCPSDADKDGVYDGLDQCANSPAGVKVNAKGCPLDGDGDGVADGVDKCDGTPKGCLVDATGCPTDADKDGVCDGLDQCSGTPADARVDAKGCPITAKETEFMDTGMMRVLNINFDTGKATIKPDSHAALDEVGNILSKWPELKIEIGGHTDSQGGEAMNQKLSEQRAASVKEYLVSKFPTLKADQISTVGYGEAKPFVKNDSALNRAKNRRVEFTVLNKEELKRVKESIETQPKN